MIDNPTGEGGAYDQTEPSGHSHSLYEHPQSSHVAVCSLNPRAYW